METGSTVRPQGYDLASQAEVALRECLADVSFLRIDRVDRGEGRGEAFPDLLFRVKGPEGETHLAVEVRSSGQPQLAREAVNLLRLNIGQGSAQYGVFVAPYISPAAAFICTQGGAGYADLAGNCLLAFGTVYVRKEGRPNPFKRDRALRSLYAPKSSRVLRVLLVNAGSRKQWRVEALANEAKVSVGQVFNVKRALEEREWIRAEREGFSLIAPQSLLEEWSAAYSHRKKKAVDFYSLMGIRESEVALARACTALGIRYALTGFSAADRFAPAVRYQRAMAYVTGDLDRVVVELGLKAVDSGATISLVSPYDEGVLYGTREIEGVSVVSPIQAYLDLRGHPGRGSEAAEALFARVINPSW